MNFPYEYDGSPNLTDSRHTTSENDQKPPPPQPEQVTSRAASLIDDSLWVKEEVHEIQLADLLAPPHALIAHPPSPPPPQRQQQLGEAQPDGNKDPGVDDLPISVLGEFSNENILSFRTGNPHSFFLSFHPLESSTDSEESRPPSALLDQERDENV